ncbi:conserved hypothetical protein [Enterobacterales bacterium 8AC]|nr:conserved hypothetical protein [Enterobacterales bacterium 8AC]
MRSDSVSQDILPELARFAWCGLVALRLAQQEGRATTPVSDAVVDHRSKAEAFPQVRGFGYR